MPEAKAIRIDKFLWSVRIFKTRSIATEACKKGRVIINNIQVKPSRTICAGEIIVVKKPPVSFTFRVIEPVENRVGAKLAGNYVEDLTPEEEKHKLELKNAGFAGYREKGTGRPTKKERRDLDSFFDGFDDFQGC
ncbi:MAG: RNA-binding S4 domain-containing protein [Bacteroidales bacterium]|jgi:ribosome-associated heat shock protein Hsp15|nr:RNA-binding S4 domain-containing protein [Bacteroidales bacterium]